MYIHIDIHTLYVYINIAIDCWAAPAAADTCFCT